MLHVIYNMYSVLEANIIFALKNNYVRKNQIEYKIAYNLTWLSYFNIHKKNFVNQ